MAGGKRARKGVRQGAVALLIPACFLLLAASSPATLPAPPPRLQPPSSQASADAVASRLPDPRPAAAPAAAVPVVSDAAQPDTASSAFVDLGHLESRDGESLDAFMVRVARVMDLFTRTTGQEVCGVPLARRDGQAWRVRLTTNRSHIGCTMVEFPVDGFARLGPDIHSHPRLVGGVLANAQDVPRKSGLECGRRIIVFDETFSAHDLARGPGYLVSRGRLLYQRGPDHPFQQRAVFDALEVLPPDFVTVAADRPGTSLPGEVAAEAAWDNRDLPQAGEDFPNTLCANSTPNHPLPGQAS